MYSRKKEILSFFFVLMFLFGSVSMVSADTFVDQIGAKITGFLYKEDTSHKCGDGICDHKIVLLERGEEKNILYDGENYSIKCVSISASAVSLMVDGETEIIAKYSSSSVNGLEIFVEGLTKYPLNSGSGLPNVVLRVGDEREDNCPKDCKNICKDSEEGKTNFKEWGYVHKGIFGYYEHCVSPGQGNMIYNRKVKQVQEYYCDGNKVKEIVHRCPGYCLNGKCIEGENTTRCYDSDGGQNYYEKGIILYGVDNSQGNADVCINKNEDGSWGEVSLEAPYLVEYSCPNSTNHGKDIYKCPNGCRNGACIKYNNKPRISCPSYCTSNETCTCTIRNCNRGHLIIRSDNGDGTNEYISIKNCTKRKMKFFPKFEDDNKLKVYFVCDNPHLVKRLIIKERETYKNVYLDKKFILNLEEKAGIRGTDYKLELSSVLYSNVSKRSRAKIVVKRIRKSEPKPTTLTTMAMEREMVDLSINESTTLGKYELTLLDVSEDSALMVVTKKEEYEYKFDVKINNGWNLLSLPGDSIRSDSSTCKVSDFLTYEYVKEKGEYKQTESMETGKSYWVYNPNNDCKVQFEVLETTSLSDLSQLKTGWNFIPIIDSMIGNQINNMGGCGSKLKGAYIYDVDKNKWDGISNKKINENYYGKGIITYTKEECTFENKPPKLPEFPEN
ncbi:MAG: hypothetical protein ABEK17_03630 [Candidatus Aenigmatarchaeota archaeon]